MKRYHRLRQLLLACALGLSAAATPAWAEPDWHKSVAELSALFTPAVALQDMASKFIYFRSIFTALGCGAVMIVAIRKVAKARGGEESMGWVASTMMTIALMASGPAIGKTIFEVCDDVANASKYNHETTLKTCWDALLVILPGDSPIMDIYESADKNPPAPEKGPTQKQDGTWTKLAWTWMKSAWNTMSNALEQIGVAFQAVATRVIVLIMLILPAITLFAGFLAVKFGLVVREVLHQTMDVFLPMMLAMLSFAPMRGAASSFVIKYIALAFWPVAWALGNAIACSILLSVMTWVVKVCTTTLQAVHHTMGLTPPELHLAAGYFSGAAVAMPWGLLIIINFVIFATSLLILVSAVGAPLALTSTFTKGANFATAQLQQAATAAGHLATTGAAVASGGSSLTVAAAAGAATGSLSSFAGRAAGAMSGAASRLAPIAAIGGPAGMMASMGARMLGGAANAMETFVMRSTEASVVESNAALQPKAVASASMLDTTSLQSSAAVAPQARSNARRFRRASPAIDV